MLFNSNLSFGLGHIGSTAVAQILYDMNITDVTGTDYLLNQGATGSTNDAIVLNATQDGVGSILVDGTTDINTGFKPNLPVYSIEETVTGELQDFGSELITSYDRFEDTNATTTVTTIDAVAINVVSAGVSAVVSPKILYNPTQQAVSDFYVAVNITVNSGNFQIRGFRWGSDFTGGVYESQVYTSGSYVFNTIIPITNTLLHYFQIYTRGDLYDFNVDLDISVKELLAPTQRTEQRLLTHDEINGDKYYINGIEQSSVPTLPDADNNINLNDTAVIGYPDTIDSREADFEVWNTIKEV